MTDLPDPADPLRRRWLGLATGAAALCTWAPGVMPARNHATPLARTRSGVLRGQTDDGVRVFRGIPYGGDTATRRFRRAQRETPWEGVRDAFDYGPSAPQPGVPDASEDCLRLNLWTPALRDEARRPVLVYVHGGGYATGSGSDPLYDGTRLARRGDVVVVSVNHRLGPLGYLHLGELGGREFASAGNVGQLDLIDALGWIAAHAAQFGGDPGNITLFGQSGGGAKIATLMAMPEARGLFHRAWTMSGQQVTAAGPRAAARRCALLMQAAGLAADDLTGLLALAPEKLVAAAQVADPSPVEDMRLYLGPVLDGQALPTHPFWPEAPARSAAIPMVIGNTRDETRAFLGRDPAAYRLSWDELPDRLARGQYVDLPVQTVIAEYRRLYPDWSPSEIYFAATTAGRSWRGAIEELEARARQGAATWAYQLDWSSPLDPDLRAYHTLDIPLVFGNLHHPTARTGQGASARRVSQALADALIAFARNGDPQHPGLPAWPQYSLRDRETLLVDDPCRVASDPRSGERRLYARGVFAQRGTF